MTEIIYRDNSTAELVDWMPRVEATPVGRITQAARVSSGVEGGQAANKALYRMLMRDRHGSPFEHVVITWRIETHLAVAREFFRHRIASYNEQSGRYRVLPPHFYIPPRERPLRQIGKPGAYSFEEGTEEQYWRMVRARKHVTQVAWQQYEEQLDAGIAKEVAREVLPLNLYTAFFVTMNLRAFTNFASLRWAHEASAEPTFPLWEIQELCKKMEFHVESIVGAVDWAAFNERGRRPI